jgi:Na+-transporting methylmalonyl-CoA/oxaloacetate decarboxylase gamma subunit
MLTGFLLGVIAAMVVRWMGDTAGRAVTTEPPKTRESSKLSVTVEVDTRDTEASLARVEAAANRAREAIERLNAAAADAESMDPTSQH